MHGFHLRIVFTLNDSQTCDRIKVGSCADLTDIILTYRHVLKGRQRFLPIIYVRVKCLVILWCPSVG